MVDIFKLLGNSQLWFDHVQKKRGRHDGTTVDLEKSCNIIQPSLQRVGNHTNHGVVGLTIVVKRDLIESPSAWLPPNVLLDHLHKSCPSTTKKIRQQSMNNLCRGDFGYQFVLISQEKSMLLLVLVFLLI